MIDYDKEIKFGNLLLILPKNDKTIGKSKCIKYLALKGIFAMLKKRRRIKLNIVTLQIRATYT